MRRLFLFYLPFVSLLSISKRQQNIITMRSVLCRFNLSGKYNIVGAQLESAADVRSRPRYLRIEVQTARSKLWTFTRYSFLLDGLYFALHRSSMLLVDLISDKRAAPNLANDSFSGVAGEERGRRKNKADIHKVLRCREAL